MHALVAGHAPARWSELSSEEVAGGLPSDRDRPWPVERTRHVLRLRSVLLEFFPAAVEAFGDLAAADALSLLGRAPDPGRAREPV